MARIASVLPASVLCLAPFVFGCGGGSSASPNPPPPDSNPVPSAISVTPSSAPAGSPDTPVTIAGSGFISSSAVKWNGTALTSTFNSSTSLTATVTAALLSGGTVGQFTVVNPAPGGGTSAPLNFSVNNPVPAIISVAPSTVAVGHSATITITGTGFEANSVVQWNGSARPTTFVSSTQLRVDLTAADLQAQGTGALTVNNPGPSASTSPGKPLSVTSQPIPVIQSAVIGNGPSSSGFCPFLQVTITGQNFDQSSVIHANNTPLQGTSMGPNTLVGFFPAGFASQPGALSFSVVNFGAPLIFSDPFPYPSASPAALALCANPSTTTVFAGATFPSPCSPPR